MKPKVFISYSWSTQVYQELVRNWAERLLADGVDVVLDLFDLQEGQDKFAFMERMVTDPKVTHVLVMSDKIYTQKADARKEGVGAESQIISQEVYNKVEQSKFIPIVCEFSDDDTPYLPIFLKSRIWIDFSSPEAVNENWERLIRLLFGKPFNEKPKLGKPPVYVIEDSATPSSPARAKYSTLRQAILQGRKGISLYRRDFLDACIDYADELRVRERPDVENLGERILDDCSKLVLVRDHIVDWVLLESETSSENEFSDVLVSFLEDLRELKSRPPEMNSWNDAWFEAHSVFVYETFLYIIASLIKTRSYTALHEVFTTHYLRPAADRYGDRAFDTFEAFYGHSETLQSVLAPEGKRLFSPAAELLKRHADREDLPFKSIIEAELLVLMLSFITPDTEWYPQTLHYASYRVDFHFFLRATQHKHFLKLAIITGIDSADKLRETVKEGHERLCVDRWHDFHHERNFWSAMNMEKLDTLK